MANTILTRQRLRQIQPAARFACVISSQFIIIGYGAISATFYKPTIIPEKKELAK